MAVVCCITDRMEGLPFYQNGSGQGTIPSPIANSSI